MALWDGRFGGSPAETMVAFSQSLDVDLPMAAEDIAGSRAHVEVLRTAELLTDDEAQSLLTGLDQVEAELASGTFVPDPAHEDVHMAVEARLTEIVGAVGQRLHTARSRNDQVATDVRLWLRTRLQTLHASVVDLVAALVDRVASDGQTLMPGFTHLQRGQPIWLGHHLLAHAWAHRRDAERLADALKRLDQCPLGAGAMAGTPHPIDRRVASMQLGFREPVPNAMDAVAARDHQIEAVSACAIVMTHLSRQAEELVVWSSSEFALVRLSEAYATGSSIMPQKRNPDAPELVRGKVGRVLGDLQALHVMVKGLPLAYNRDLQEDRQALFDAVLTTQQCVAITADVWRTLEVHRERYIDALQGDFLLATEIADFLVTRGVPFREAHHVSGQVVAWCEAKGVNLSALTAEIVPTFHPQLTAEVLGWLDPVAAAERRTSLGGTAWAQVTDQVKALRTWIAEASQTV
ncbi:MAG: argininosuccinate lyase [Myxococcota bacterium]